MSYLTMANHRTRAKIVLLKGKNSILLHITAKFINPKNVKNTEPPTQTQKQINNTIFPLQQYYYYPQPQITNQAQDKNFGCHKKTQSIDIIHRFRSMALVPEPNFWVHFYKEDFSLKHLRNPHHNSRIFRGSRILVICVLTCHDQ